MRCFCYFLSVVLVFSHGAPMNKHVFPSKEMYSFMEQFGYVEKGGDAQSQYTVEGLSNVIKNMQKFGAIPQTGVIDNATLALLKKPRCGVPDVIRSTSRRKRFVSSRLGGWKKRDITFYIANWSSRLDRDTVKKNIILALDTWGKYGRLKFREVFDPSADIIVAFASGYHNDRYPFDGPGNVLAHAFFPNEFGSLGGDIHFDEDEPWTDKYDPDQDGMYFFTVALHELGHSLGLSHSPVETSIMFPYYKGSDPSKFALDYDDILGMYELYIKTYIPDGTPPPSPKQEDDYDYDTSKEKEESDESIESGESYPTHTEHYSSTTETYTPRNHPTQASSEQDHTVSYHGDTESVDDHKNHDDKFNFPTTHAPSLPDICEGNYDAVATLRDELFFFKEEYIWRFKDKQQIERGYPIKLSHMFPQLPTNIKRIDAAYQRPDGMIVLFTGQLYWVFDGNQFVEGSPRPLTDYGLPRKLKKIDAVQVWEKNKKTYIYSKDKFWRYNETSKEMDVEYPKSMDRWRNVPNNLDAATTWKDGKTYFFKGKLFWKFDNVWINVDEKSPLPTPQLFLGCPKEMDLYVPSYAD